ncbi:MAG: FAD-binding oxidoreductase [Nocardioidaceae bacterium]
MSAFHRVSEDRTVEPEMLRPGDPAYDETRRVWNAIVDRRPRMIVRCMGVSDVVRAVRTARELDLDIGIRCGGHSVVGHAVPDDGMMIDLTPMGAVRVDPRRRRAWVQGGALLGALDRASQRFGLATTAGNVSHTGVGGLTLGGGMGWLARQYGLSCDNVVAFEVVTADGQVVRASDTEHPDLFWALRGGGGNFGVVTEFEFRLHAVGPEALSVELDFPLGEAEPVLRGWRDLNSTAPRQATFMAAIGGDQLTVGFVGIGDLRADSERLLSSLRALGRPVGERVEPMSYLDLQRRDDTVGGHRQRRYWKGHYFRRLPDEVIDLVLRLPSPADLAPNVSLQAYGGAIADVPDSDTAFSHRDTMVELVAAARWTDPDEDEARIRTAREYAGPLQPYASGAYVNALDDEGAAGVRRAYSPDKLSRLTAVKDTYDPGNVFRLNHNIRPSSHIG